MTEITVLYILLGIIALIVIILHFSVVAWVDASREKVDIKVKFLWFDIYPRKPKKKKKKKRKRKKKKEKKAENFDVSLEEDFSVPDTPIEELLKLDVEEVEPSKEPEKDIPQEQAAQGEEMPYEEQTMQAADDSNETEQGAEEKEASHEDRSEETAEKSSEEKREEPEKKDKKEKNEPKEPKEPSRLDKLKSRYEQVKPYIPMGWKYFKKLLKTIRITDLKINITTGKEDAAQSALFYGKLQGVLFGALSVISGIFTVKVEEANVNCVFNEKILDGSVHTKIKVRPSTLIAIAVCIGVSFLKIWMPKFLAKRKKRKIERKDAEKERSDEMAA